MYFGLLLCVSLSIAVGALYVRKYFRQDSKAAALEMVNNIRKEFENILEEVNWMDDKVKIEVFVLINLL